jgi:radical SAM superfamily enzyme YgiQ (UPF0313 family)
MKIGCVYSVERYYSAEKPLLTFSAIPFGLSHIATSLKSAGHDPKITILTKQDNIPKKISAFIKQHQPRIFCLTAVTSHYDLMCQVARAIKEIDDSINVIIGGHHVTLNPDESIKNPYFDAICVGEGELAIVEYVSMLINNQSPGRINNLWIKKKSEDFVEKNSQDRFIENLDELPYIHRGMWDEWVAVKDRVHSVLLGRGCANRCSYCSNHAIRRTSPGKYVRLRSPENVTGELNEIVENYPSVSSIYFEIEDFGVKLQYVYDICDHLEKFNAKTGMRINFGTNFSVTKKIVNNEDMLKRLKRANFQYLNIGLESGSERVRNEILRRPRYSNEDIISFCKLAQKNEINITLYVMMGIPGETLEDYKETISCVRKCNPHRVYPAIFYPYPGTDLYTTAKNMNLFESQILDPATERRKAVLDLPGFSRKQIQRQYILFPYKAFKGRLGIIIILAMMLRHYLSMYPRLLSIYIKSRVFLFKYLKIGKR